MPTWQDFQPFIVAGLALGGVLGTEVKVRPRGTGYKVELAVESLDEALALARRVRAGA